jgi:hypothetical protein
MVARQTPNGVRYWRWGGRGFCLGAGKTRSQKMLENAAESLASSARCVRHIFYLTVNDADAIG